MKFAHILVAGAIVVASAQTARAQNPLELGIRIGAASQRFGDEARLIDGVCNSARGRQSDLCTILIHNAVRIMITNDNAASLLVILSYIEPRHRQAYIANFVRDKIMDRLGGIDIESLNTALSGLTDPRVQQIGENLIRQQRQIQSLFQQARPIIAE